VFETIVRELDGLKLCTISKAEEMYGKYRILCRPNLGPYAFSIKPALPAPSSSSSSSTSASSLELLDTDTEAEKSEKVRI
ncbi:MAG TPA: hypothetical protein VN457_02245, partial [Chlamydiales bacterium]|nr:hypothetical protein [Chlamydiales bacterium]